MKVDFKSIVYATILAVTSYCLGALTTSTFADPFPIEHNDGRFKEETKKRDYDEVDLNNYRKTLTDSLRTHLGVVQDGKYAYAIYYLTTYKYDDKNKNGTKDYNEIIRPIYVYQKELVK